MVKAEFLKLFLLLPGLFWIRKITMDPHILAHANTASRDDKYPKQKLYTSETDLK
jgi:hypothetical protein